MTDEVTKYLMEIKEAVARVEEKQDSFSDSFKEHKDEAAETKKEVIVLRSKINKAEGGIALLGIILIVLKAIEYTS